MNFDYATGNGKHAYEITAAKAGTRERFTVWANNRNQAARRLEKDGFEVFDVNMVG